MKRRVFMERKNILTMNDEEITKTFQQAVDEKIRVNREKGNPVCGYDLELRKSYILYPNGEKVYG